MVEYFSSSLLRGHKINFKIGIYLKTSYRINSTLLILLALLFIGCSATEKNIQLDPSASIKPVRHELKSSQISIVPGDTIEIHFYKSYKNAQEEYRLDIGDRLYIKLDSNGDKSNLEQAGSAYKIKTGDTILVHYYKRYLTEGESYTLDVGDTLNITVHSHPEYSKDVVVLPDGTISVVKVGVVKAKGLTVSQLDALLTEKYADELITPDIDVFVLEARKKLNDIVDLLSKNMDATYGKLTVTLDGAIDFPLIGQVKVAGDTILNAKKMANDLYREQFCDVKVSLNIVKEPPPIISDSAYTNSVVVLPDGNISVSKLGLIKAKGLSITELNNLLTEKFKEKFLEPKVDIVIFEVQKRLTDFFDLLSQNYNLRSKNFIVEMDGNVNLPIVGKVNVSGMSLSEASQIVSEKYRSASLDLEVNFNLTKSVRVTVAVMGEVQNPGVYQLSGRVSPLYALALAGGELNTANLTKVLILRGTLEEPEKIFVDLKNNGKWISQDNAYVQAGDIVYVFKSGIANVDLYVDQYIRKLLPFSMGTGLYYNLKEQ